jgi:glycosyltransferase involved in cell wall biosynthesis
MLRFLEEREGRVRELLDRVDLLLSPSRFLGARFEEAGASADKIRYWPYGLDLGPFVAASARNRHREGPLRVGFVGSIVPKKGVDVLVRAHRLLPRGRCLLRISGRLEFLPRYGAALRRLAVEGECAFLGGFDPDDAPRIMSALDVLVVPSVWYENAPIVISEAFAAGVPVVASRLGGMAEMVRDGVDGRLFAPGDPEDLARVLAEVIEDPGELVRLRRGVRPPRSIEEDAAGLERLYAELIGARQ